MLANFIYLIVILIWGSTWYAITFQIEGVPLAWSVTYRFGLAALILLMINRLLGINLRFTRKEHVGLLGIGFFMFSVNYLFVYISTEHLTSGLVALAFSCMTFWNIINARLWLKIAIDPRVGLAALLGLIGLSLLFSAELNGFSFDKTIGVGILFGLASGVMASFGNTIVAGGIFGKASPLAVNGWGLFYGTVINSLIALSIAGLPIIRMDTPYLLALAYLSLFGTVVTFSLYIWLIREMGMTRPAYIAVLTPVVALTISSFWENYQWSPTSTAGFILVMAGNLLMIKTKQKIKSKALAH